MYQFENGASWNFKRTSKLTIHRPGRSLRPPVGGQQALREVLIVKTYAAKDVARYLLAKADSDDGDLISNLKLQKLCYYVQGLGLVVRGGTPIFRERIEAWLHGPVLPDLYGEYRQYGREAIPPDTVDLSQYDPQDRMLMDDVFDYYGQYSAWRLRQMTHQEPPWKDAFVEGMNRIISNDAMLEYFSSQVEPSYKAKYDEISKAETG